jgi:hypothetical protein
MSAAMTSTTERTMASDGRFEIFVRLVEEDVDVWRPVAARHIDGRRYRIDDQPYDRRAERWEYEPGDEVEGRRQRRGDQTIVVVTGRAGQERDRL